MNLPNTGNTSVVNVAGQCTNLCPIVAKDNTENII